MKKKADPFAAFAKKILQTKSKYIRAYVNRKIYPRVQKYLYDMFITGGMSEGHNWRTEYTISKAWKEHKLEAKTRYPNLFPGGDRPALYSGLLMGSVVGPALAKAAPGQVAEGAQKYHRKMVRGDSLVVASAVPYFADLPYSLKLSTASKTLINKDVRAFVKEAFDKT